MSGRNRTRYDLDVLGEQQGSTSRGLRGMVRRMAVQATSALLWRLKGHTIDGVVESPEAQPFQGVGFFSRPAKGSRAEAIMVSVGEAQHAVIVATRDEDLRRLHKTALEAGPDMAAMFNKATIVIIKPDNTCEIRSRTGVALSLAPKAELSRLHAALLTASQALADAGAPGAPGKIAVDAVIVALDALVPPWPAGTTVLKAE